MMGSMTKTDVFGILDFFYSQGGNFIDTASNYQSEQSETWIGEWLASKPEGFRDQMVIATKFTTGYLAYKGSDNIIQSNYIGNNKKTLKHSLDASLKKLQTDYIDVLYVHWWDFTTSIPELMHSLNDVVAAGKVLYLGISDTPAWIVSKANEYARQKGLRQFVVYQGRWSAAERDFERDILDMCAHEGMALAPWGALGSGKFKTKAQWEEKHNAGGEGRQMGAASAKEEKISAVLETVAKKYDTALTSVALAYVMHKAPYVFPIVGGRKIEHLKGNIEALGLELTQADIDEIEGAAEFDIGFPLGFLGNFGRDPAKGAHGPGEVQMEQMTIKADYVKGALPIRPKKSRGEGN
ncbi:MAG: hypothetical protein Q9195_006731 [Heterodermia aff. obscurata]